MLLNNFGMPVKQRTYLMLRDILILPAMSKFLFQYCIQVFHRAAEMGKITSFYYFCFQLIAVKMKKPVIFIRKMRKWNVVVDGRNYDIKQKSNSLVINGNKTKLKDLMSKKDGIYRVYQVPTGTKKAQF